MEVRDEALVLTRLPHGEHGVVVRFLGQAHGLQSGYVAGGRGRAKRALLAPGNKVALTLRVRREGQLASAGIEALESRALIAFDADAAAALDWLVELAAATLAEAVPHPRLFAALDALLAGLSAGMDPNRALAGVAHFEMLLLEELGLGLDLSGCALGGAAETLAFVSPKSGRAVSREKAEGQPWQTRLLPLPAFLWREVVPDTGETVAALALTGHFLHRHGLANRPGVAAARARLLARVSGTSQERLAVASAVSKAGE